MAENELPPMTPGGEWMYDGSHRHPVYVTHEAHIKRLLSEGFRPVPDPRRPAPPEETKPVSSPKEEDLAAQLAAALERIKALESQGGEDPPDGSEPTKAPRRTKG